MRIAITSVPVDDQAKALAFYTGVLGFVVKRDIPVGPSRWLTVLAPDGPEDVELLLEPTDIAAAKTYQQALFESGIPYTLFAVDDLAGEYERLRAAGVVFRQSPTSGPGPRIAVFEDTCGNLIQLYQE